MSYQVMQFPCAGLAHREGGKPPVLVGEIKYTPNVKAKRRPDH
jgi:hypothetical protein